MIIDAHIHISENGKWFNTEFDASVERAIYEMEEAGVDKALVLPLPGLNQIGSLYNKVEKYNDQLKLCTYVNMGNGNERLNLRNMVTEYGFRGIKIHPRIQKIDPLDERLFDIYEEACDLGIPIIFDAWPQNDAILLENIQPFVFDQIAKRFQELKIVIAHLGGHKMWDTFFVARSNHNVYTDISFVLDFFRGSSYMEDIRWILSNLDRKIVYGSDFPEKSISSYHKRALEIANEIRTEKLDNIFYKNAEDLFNL